MIINKISQALRNLADKIDDGSSYMTQEEQMELINIIKSFDKEKEFSKYQAFHYLHMSRATFDNLIREGKISKGHKVQGFNELRWYRKDLDKYWKENYSKNKSL